MARFRLRFLLQEFDLPRGVTVIGRSLECNITIEDPLVSRQHARIVIDDVSQTVEDLGARNGVRVNGVQIQGPTPLNDGDRVRIGTQDFVFCKVDTAGRGHSKTTGVLRLCSKCHLPYPRESISCPNCEATEQSDEDTLSGSVDDGTPGAPRNQSTWTVQLLAEALARALQLGRLPDVDRIARQATAQIDDQLASGGSVEGKTLANLALQAAAATVLTNDPTWAFWVFDVYRRAHRVPPVEVVERAGEAGSPHSGVLRPAVERLLEAVRAARDGDDGDATLVQSDGDAVERLEQLRLAYAELSAGPADATAEWRRPS